MNSILISKVRHFSQKQNNLITEWFHISTNEIKEIELELNFVSLVEEVLEWIIINNLKES